MKHVFLFTLVDIINTYTTLTILQTGRAVYKLINKHCPPSADYYKRRDCTTELAA